MRVNRSFQSNWSKRGHKVIFIRAKQQAFNSVIAVQIINFFVKLCYFNSKIYSKSKGKKEKRDCLLKLSTNLLIYLHDCIIKININKIK